MKVTLGIRRLENHDPDLPLPAYATGGAAGMDIAACLALSDRPGGLKIPPLGRALLPTGLALAVPEGFEAQVRPRSGLALRLGLTVLNSPGTIDSDYRGEVNVLLANLGAEMATVRHGDRIAQLLIAPVARAYLDVLSELDETARGTGGFGSTGSA